MAAQGDYTSSPVVPRWRRCAAASREMMGTRCLCDEPLSAWKHCARLQPHRRVRLPPRRFFWRVLTILLMLSNGPDPAVESLTVDLEERVPGIWTETGKPKQLRRFASLVESKRLHLPSE